MKEMKEVGQNPLPVREALSTLPSSPILTRGVWRLLRSEQGRGICDRRCRVRGQNQGTVQPAEVWPCLKHLHLANFNHRVQPLEALGVTTDCAIRNHGFSGQKNQHRASEEWQTGELSHERGRSSLPPFLLCTQLLLLQPQSRRKRQKEERCEGGFQQRNERSMQGRVTTFMCCLYFFPATIVSRRNIIEVLLAHARGHARAARRPSPPKVLPLFSRKKSAKIRK